MIISKKEYDELIKLRNENTTLKNEKKELEEEIGVLRLERDQFMKDCKELRSTYEGLNQHAEESKAADAALVPIKLLTISCPGLLGDFK